MSTLSKQIQWLEAVQLAANFELNQFLPLTPLGKACYPWFEARKKMAQDYLSSPEFSEDRMYLAQQIQKCNYEISKILGLAS